MGARACADADERWKRTALLPGLLSRVQVTRALSARLLSFTKPSTQFGRRHIAAVPGGEGGGGVLELGWRLAGGQQKPSCLPAAKKAPPRAGALLGVLSVAPSCSWSRSTCGSVPVRCSTIPAGGGGGGG